MGLPVNGYIENVARTVADMKTILSSNIRDFISQLAGGGPRTGLTISGGVITPGVRDHGGRFTIETEASVAADDVDLIAQTNTSDGQEVVLYQFNSARVPTLKHANGATGQMLMRDSSDFVLDALDKWIKFVRRGTSWVEECRSYGIDYLSARNDMRVQRIPQAGMLCPLENFKMDYASAATVTCTADAAYLTDTNGNQKRFAAVSKTLTISSTGAGGREVAENAGAEKASDWYHIWLIGKEDGTINMFGSLAAFPGGSSIFSLLPSGYTYAGYCGAAYNDASSNILDFWQRGDMAWTDAVAVLSGGTATTKTNLSLAALIPDTAYLVKLAIGVSPASSGTAATGNVYPDQGTTNGGVTLQFQPATTTQTLIPLELLLRAPQLMAYNVSTGDSMGIWVNGWRY